MLLGLGGGAGESARIGKRRQRSCVEQRVTERTFDLRPGDLACRYGGEEFLLVLPGCDLDAAITVSERARLAVAEPEPAAGAPPVSVSIGVACTIEAGQDPQALVIAADQALYRAKASGRNCVAA